MNHIKWLWLWIWSTYSYKPPSLSDKTFKSLNLKLLALLIPYSKSKSFSELDFTSSLKCWKKIWEFCCNPLQITLKFNSSFTRLFHSLQLTIYWQIYVWHTFSQVNSDAPLERNTANASNILLKLTKIQKEWLF